MKSVLMLLLMLLPQISSAQETVNENITRISLEKHDKMLEEASKRRAKARARFELLLKKKKDQVDAIDKATGNEQ